MTISVYAMAVETFVPMLRNLRALLDKAAQHASAKGLDAAELPEARLAPDMFPLVKQVQVACDQAKNATARLVGQEPPRFADDETTLDDLQARIAKTIDYVSSLPRGSFEGAEDRDIVVPLPNDRALEMKGARFLGQWALPHFYFHIVTAYDILRHKGVEIGKRDFMAHSGDAIRQRSGT